MTRAFVLETAENIQRTFDLFQEVGEPGTVQHSWRTRAGGNERATLSWGKLDGDFGKFLLDHYNANMGVLFEVDLNDGDGAVESWYVGAPRFTCAGDILTTWSVTIERVRG